MAVPPRTGARGLATTALATATAALLFELVNLVWGLVGTRTMLANPGAAGATVGFALVLTVLAGLLNLVKLFTYLVFLKKVANHLRAYAAARSAGTVMGLYAGFYGLLILTMGIGMAILGATVLRLLQGAGGGGVAPPNMEALGAGILVVCGLGCVTGIVGLTAFIWYIVLLGQVRGAISDRRS
jgi:hypothetical protein